MGETQSLDLTRLGRGRHAKNQKQQCQDIAWLGAAAIGFTTAFLFRKSARKAKHGNAALLQDLRLLQEAHNRLEAEYKLLQSQHSQAATKADDCALVATKAEVKVDQLQTQLSEKIQEYEQLLQTLTFERNKALSELQITTLSLDHAKNEYAVMCSESKQVVDEAKRRVKELEERASAAKADTDRVRRKLTRKEAELSALKARYPGQIQSEADSPMTARSIDSNASSTPFSNSRQALREINTAAEHSPQLAFGERKAKLGLGPE